MFEPEQRYSHLQTQAVYAAAFAQTRDHDSDLALERLAQLADHPSPVDRTYLWEAVYRGVADHCLWLAEAAEGDAHRAQQYHQAS